MLGFGLCLWQHNVGSQIPPYVCCRTVQRMGSTSLTVNGERREWREVPYPEKLWLVRKVLEQGPDDPARAVAQLIGLGRISTNFRNEIAALVDRVKGGMGER